MSKNRLVLAHIKSYTHTVVVLTQVTHRFEGGVAADGSNHLEDGEQLLGYEFVADELANMCAAFEVVVRNAQVAQVGAADIRVIVPSLALHGLPHAIGDSLRGKYLALRTKSAAKPDRDSSE